MQKIPTLYERDWDNNPSRVTEKINPEAEWLLHEQAFATIKRDGQNVRVVIDLDADGERRYRLERRYNPGRKEKVEAAARGANPPSPRYIPADENNPENKHILAAYYAGRSDWEYWPMGEWPCEALGPKIQGNPEGLTEPELYPFSLYPWLVLGEPEIVYGEIREYLEFSAIEGIVWHSADKTKMVKIKRRDFGFAWPPKDGEKLVRNTGGMLI